MGETLLLQDQGSKAIIKEVIASSRKLYAKKYKPNEANTKTTEKKQISKKTSTKTDVPEPIEV